MKCPKCGKDMEEGFSVVEPEGWGVLVKWYGKEEERSVMGGEPIYKGPSMGREWLDAFRCRDCNAVTVTLPKELKKSKSKPPF